MGNRNLKEQLIAEIVRRVAEEMTFTVQVVEEDEGGYSAFIEELPGCITQGDTREELEFNLAEAITVYLESVADDVIEAHPEWQRLLPSAGGPPVQELVGLVKQKIAAIPPWPEEDEEDDGLVSHPETYRLPLGVQ